MVAHMQHVVAEWMSCVAPILMCHTGQACAPESQLVKFWAQKLLVPDAQRVHVVCVSYIAWNKLAQV